ncbi:helix-turn-helix domain-containing protein [Nonomuraea sp. NPDC050790]|uniref:helix-turn-helix domain-containing protein n=1 Tax=Nonomuraea sp. NPDC050790 TaxID=3364371 RepID=UPI0037873AF3
MTAFDLDDLVERMAVPAAGLVAAVQGENVDHAHAVLSALTALELRALAVRLADWAPGPAVEVLQRLSETRHWCKSGEAGRIRHQALLSRPEIAVVVGVSPSAIQDWENGGGLPRGENAIRYGVVLNRLRAGLGERG